MKPLATPLFALVLTLLPGCSDPENDSESNQTEDDESSMATLSGTVIYRERMALPPEATVVVTLEDVSKMDAPATILAKSSNAAEGGPPYPFSLEYDKGAIEEKGRYGLRAKIELDGRLMFTSSEFIPAFDEAREEPVEILVRRTTTVTTGNTQSTPAEDSAPLVGTAWTVTEIEGTPAQPGDQDEELNLTFSDETVSGFAGCNSFTGGFETSETGLTLGPLATTLKAAIDPAVAKQEQQFLSALDKVSGYAISGKKLMLKDETDKTIILCEAP